MVEEVNADRQTEPQPAPADGEHVEVAEPGFGNFDLLHQLVRLLLARMFAVTECLFDRHWQILLHQVHQRSQHDDDERQLQEQNVN